MASLFHEIHYIFCNCHYFLFLLHSTIEFCYNVLLYGYDSHFVQGQTVYNWSPYRLASLLLLRIGRGPRLLSNILTCSQSWMGLLLQWSALCCKASAKNRPGAMWLKEKALLVFGFGAFCIFRRRISFFTWLQLL